MKVRGSCGCFNQMHRSFVGILRVAKGQLPQDDKGLGVVARHPSTSPPASLRASAKQDRLLKPSLSVGTPQPR